MENPKCLENGPFWDQKWVQKWVKNAFFHVPFLAGVLHYSMYTHMYSTLDHCQHVTLHGKSGSVCHVTDQWYNLDGGVGYLSYSSRCRGHTSMLLMQVKGLFFATS